MKKVIWLFTISLLLVACSGGNSDEENNGINVEKGKNQVEITLPADIIEAEEKDMDEIIADAEENGIDEVVKNQDGSLTYKMSKEKHEEMMEQLDEQIKNIMETLRGEKYPSIQKAETDESFTEFTVKVDKGSFENSLDGLSVVQLGMGGVYYQLFNGTKLEEIEVKVFIENNETNEVMDIFVFPKVLMETENRK